MNGLQQILLHYFSRSGLMDIPVEQLEAFTMQHPLFAPGHFFLAKKYAQEDHPSANRQLLKTSLYFHNPLWLQFQLSRNENADDTMVYERPVASVPSPAPAVTVPADHDLLEEVVTHQEGFEESIPPATTEIEIAEEVPDEREQERDPNEQNTEAIASVADVPELAMIATEDFTPPSGVSVQDPPAEVAGEYDDQDPDDTDGFEKPVPGSVHPLFSRIGLKEAKENGPTFEPFHTVDYFASQGIKISHELKPEDRIGKQLKSFTEWLKTMRRLPEAVVEAELDKTNDNQIREIAEHSLQEQEIVTEAMAEVLARQGRPAQAIHVYEKLSLIHTDKSAYFAAKIEALKQH